MPLKSPQNAGEFALYQVLRISPLDGNGEQIGGATRDLVRVLGLNGTPEGRLRGSPGDVAVRRDAPGIWQKMTGYRTVSGWAQVGGSSSGGGGGNQLDLIGLNAAVCGTTNDTVALFEDTPAPQDWFTYAANAEDGSSFKIRVAGVYFVDWRALMSGSDDVSAGVSVDATASTRTRAPTRSQAGVLITDRWGGDNEIGGSEMLQCSAPIVIDAAMASDPALGVIRCQVGTSGNQTPGGITIGQCYCTITYMGPYSLL